MNEDLRRMNVLQTLDELAHHDGRDKAREILSEWQDKNPVSDCSAFGALGRDLEAELDGAIQMVIARGGAEEGSISADLIRRMKAMLKHFKYHKQNGGTEV